MKKKYLVFSLLLVATIGTAQTIAFLNQKQSFSGYDLEFGNLELDKTHHLVVRFKNTGSYPMRVARVEFAGRYHEESNDFFRIEYSGKDIPCGAIDSIVFTARPTEKAYAHNPLFDIRLVSTTLSPERRSYVSVELNFKTIPPFSPDAIIGFPNPEKRYSIGKVYWIKDAPPTPLVYFNKGKAPLYVAEYGVKTEASRSNMRANAVKSGQKSSLEYLPKYTRFGHFDDTLHLITNGLDSLHTVIVSGELLELAEGRPIAQIICKDNVFKLDTLTEGARCVFEIPVKNIGKMPLLIRNVRTNDGGSMASWYKEPILPNESGTVEFRYDTNRIGPFSKSLTIETNEVNGFYVFAVRGIVLAKSQKTKD